MGSSAKHRFQKSHLARFVSWLGFHNPVDILARAIPLRSLGGDRKRVVFVKMDGIGDHVIWTASFGQIEQAFPSLEYELILVTNQRNRDLAETAALFERKIYVDVRPFASSPLYRFRKLRDIRALDADIVINPRTTRDFLWGDSIVRVSGAPVRIGSMGISNMMSPLLDRVSARWYTELRPGPRAGVHELVSNIEFLGGDKSAINVPKKIAAPDGSNFLTVLPSTGYAVIFVGAFTADKRWPISSFAQAAKMIESEHDLRIVLCGGPGEQKLGEEFAREFEGEFTNLIGRMTLFELSAIISGAKLIVSNDTSAGHIAVAQNCPAVVITPGNHVGRYYPYPDELSRMGVALIAVTHEMPCFGCGWNCIYTEIPEDLPKPCISNIAVTEVVQAASTLLKQRNSASA